MHRYNLNTFAKYKNCRRVARYAYGLCRHIAPADGQGDLEGIGVMRHAQTSTIAVVSALAAQAAHTSMVTCVQLNVGAAMKPESSIQRPSHHSPPSAHGIQRGAVDHPAAVTISNVMLRGSRQFRPKPSEL